MTSNQTNAPRTCRDCGKPLPPKKVGGRARVRCEQCSQAPRNGDGPCVVCGGARPPQFNGRLARACSEKCRQKWIAQRFATAAAKATKRA